ncbi:porin family protein [Cytophaga aurantiaca]|uniref:porin family protein n=1 Tax=Cytophaga aurantiaca TaxID=29530 RepID=UPI00035C5C4C|nr:porin family protein [Cytophaga aurantiaca]
MKHFILLFTFITISAAASAQIRLGVRAGVTFNDLMFIHTQDPDMKSSTTGFTYFNAAAVANYKINTLFSLQTEFIYTTLGKDYTQHTYQTNIVGDVYTNYTNVKIRLQYFEIPVLAKFTFFKNSKVNLNLLAGAFAGYNISAKQKNGDDSFQNISSDYTSWNSGITLGVGFSIMQKRMFFEMRANRGFVDINKTNEKVNTFQAMYTVGYYLFREKKK